MKVGMKIAVPFVLALLIICIVGMQSYLGIRHVNEANRMVIQTQSIQEKLEHVLSMVKDAETGQRGFVLTGEDSYLEPYNAAIDEIPKHIDEVVALILDDPEQQKSIELLRNLSRDKFDELEETIKLRRETGMEAALSVIRQDRGKKIMDDMRTLIDQMSSRESKLLDQQNQVVGEIAHRSFLMLGFGVFLALIILGAAVFVFARTMKLADQSPASGDSGLNWKRIVVRYFFAMVIVAVATVLRLWLVRTFGPMPLFVTWYPAVLLTAIVAGGGPGIFATILSVLTADYRFIEPIGHLGIPAANDAIATGIFAGTGIFLSIFAERLKRAQVAEAVSLTQEKELALLNEGNLMTLDLDHRIINWSEGNRKLYGFDIGEVRGQFTYEILRTKFDRLTEEIHKELMETNHWEGEVSRIAKNGALISVALLWALRRDEDGKPLAILEVSTDITRQKLAEESLREQAEELAQQNEELHAQSEELAQLSEELAEQNEELQTQSEEIQSLNAELTHREHILEILLDAARLPIGEHEMMGKICRAALDMIGQAARGAVVCEAGDSGLSILADAGFENGAVPGSWPLKGSFIEMVMQQDRTAALEDSSLRPDFNLLPVAGLPRFASALSSPVHINNKCIGAVSVYSDKPQRWTAEQFRLIEWLAAKCSNTLTAMRLAEEVQQSRKQNDFLADVIHRSSQAFGVGYPDGRLGLINRAFEELTGYTGEELRSIDWVKMLTPPEWVDFEQEKLEELHRTGQPVRYEKEYIHKDGRRVPIELLVHIIKDEEGQPLYYYSFINDITERKKAERELLIVTQRFYNILSGMHTSVLLVTDEDMVEFANQAFCNQFGLSDNPSALSGLTAADMLMKIKNAYADPEAALARIREIIADSKSVKAEEIAMHDGKTLLRDYIHLKVNEKSYGRLWLHYDITGRKQAEEALKRSEARWNAAIESFAEGAIIATEDEQVIYWNPSAQAMHGFTRPDEGIEPLEKTLITFQLWTPDGSHMLELDEWPMRRIKRGETVRNLELRIRRPDQGWEKVFSYSGTMLATAEGERLIFLTCHDVTELRLAEQALRDSERRLIGVLESMPDAFVSLDADMRYTYVNANAERLQAASREELIGKDIRIVYPDAESYKTISQYERVFREQKPMTLISFHAGFDRWVEARAFSTPDGVSVFYKDVSAQVKAEDALRKSEEKYRNLFINMTEEVHFWQLVRDEEGKIKTWRLVDANPPTLKTWGRETIDEIRGKTTDEIFGPGATEHYMPVVQRIMNEGTPYVYEDYFPNLDKHFRFTSVPFGDFFITTGADITAITKVHELVRASEERLKRSQEVAHLGSWELDLVKNRLIWSDEVYRIFGLKVQGFDATYDAFLDRVYPEDQQAVDDAYTGSIRDGRDTYEIEHRVVRKDTGEVRVVHEKCEHFRDPVTGEIVRSVGMVHDITERKQSEEEIKRTTERFQILTNNLRSGVALIDNQGRFAIVNPEFLRMFELSVDSNIRNVNDRNWAEWQVFNEYGSLLDVDEHPVRKAALSGKAVRNKLVGVLAPSGSDMKWMLVSAEPVKKQDGGLDAIICTYQDMTAQKLSEEALRRSEEKFSVIFKKAAFSAALLQFPEGELVDINEEFERASGYTRQEAIGKTLEELGIFKEPELGEHFINELRQNGYVHNIEINLEPRYGGIRTYIVNLDVVAISGYRHVMASAQDITERKLIEQELRKSHDELEMRVRERTSELSAAVTMLEQANMELQEFTHVTSHDLQEPLRKIQTFCDLLNKRSASFLDNAGQEYLNRVLNSVLRMRQLLSDLLQLSRMAGKSEPFEAVDLGKIAHEAVDLFEEDLKKSSGKVKIGSLPVIDAEETQMLRLFQNLIGNAVKYHDEKNILINIFSRHDGNICEIFIKDNGIGFEQEFAERIFKPFQRLHGRNQYEGTGIGLAICRKIVERHGGSIRAESEPGKGSTFIINLPVKHRNRGD